MSLNLVQRFALATRAAVGIFRGEPEISAQVLQAIFPRRGDPPRRGTPGILRAYSEMPWLRAVTMKVATMSATSRWHVYAVKRKSNTGAKRWIRDYTAQRAPVDLRRKLLTGLAQSGELVEIEEHPFLTAWQGGGTYLTGMQNRKLLQIYLDLVGEGFLLKERNGAGACIGLWPVPPSWIITVPTPQQRWYWIVFRNQRLQVPDTEVAWIFDPDPYNPYGRATGIASSLADELDTQEFASKHVRAYFFNQARPDFLAWVKNDANAPNSRVSETELERIKLKWLQQHQNVFRRWMPHFVNRELGIYEFKQDLQATQAIPLLEHERDTIIQIFGIPPEIMAIINESKRATIDVAAFHMGLFVVQPRLEFLRDYFQERLFPEYDDRLICEYDSPIPEDREFALEVMKSASWAYSMDDIRALSSVPVLGPEKGGNLHPVPINISLVPEEELGLPPEPAAPIADDGDGGEDTGLEEDTQDGDAADGGTKALPARRSLPRRLTRGLRPGTRRKGGRPAISYALVHRIADQLEPKARRAFLDAIARAQPDDLTALEHALEAGDIQRAIDTLHLERIGEALVGAGGLKEILDRAVLAAGDAAAAAAPQVLGLTLEFRHTFPAAAQWAKQHVGSLIRQISEEQRHAIRDLIAQSFEQGITVARTARRIREVVGLTERQMRQVARFRAQMAEDEVAADVLERRAGKYAEALLRRRAETIARTETLDAASAGQQALWDQAVDDGLLKAEEWHKVPLVTDDDALDTVVCEPMPTMPENEDVPINGEFTTGDGQKRAGPPYHPRCRCAVALERRES